MSVRALLLTMVLCGGTSAWGQAKNLRYTPWRPHVRKLVQHQISSHSNLTKVIHFNDGLSVVLGSTVDIEEKLCAIPDGIGITYSTDIGSVSVSGSSNINIASDTCSGITFAGSGCCSIHLNYEPTDIGVEYPILSLPSVTTTTTDAGSSTADSTEEVDLTLKTVMADPKNGRTDCGSIIHTDNQSIAERVPIVGTPYDLYYSTEFMTGYVGVTLPAISFFISDEFNISVQHFYDSSQQKIFYGTGTSTALPYTTLSSGNLMVVSSDGDEVYIFASNGKHLETKSFLTGAMIYSFSYDSSDRLSSITDAYGNVTTINRDSSGNLSSIVGPYGQSTSIVVSGGLVRSITNPNSETYSFTYKSGTVLMETFTKPGGQVSTMTYDSHGLLTKDQGNGGNYWNFYRDTSASDHPLIKNSRMGRYWSYKTAVQDGIIPLGGGVTKSLNDVTYVSKETTPYGQENVIEEGAINKRTDHIVDTEDAQADDERFGAIYKRTASRLTRMNSVDSTTDFGQTVSWPTGVTDPFGFDSITMTATTSSRTTTSVYTASTKTSVTTTPEGAMRTVIYNTHEDPTSNQVGSDTATTYTYDTHGRISEVAQGTHNILDYAYNTAGYLQSVTDALSHVTSYAYDLAGRVTSVTLPDTRVIAYGYDANGNLTSVTPPSKPLHGISFNAMELMDTYSPPALTGLTTKNTTYSYNDDKQLTAIHRPDGTSVSYAYDSTTGLLSSVTLPTGSFGYTYKTNSPQYDILTSPDGISDTFGWYGYSVKSDAQKIASSGWVWGKVTFGFDTDHRLTSRALQGHSGSTTYVRNISYNNDDQPTQIGDETLTYEYPSGRLSTTSVGKISDSRTYDTYGELAGYTAVYTPTSGSPQTLYSYTLTKDLMGKITEKSETVLGSTDVYDYSYDSAGRLTQVLKNSNPYSSYTYDDNGNRTSGTTAGASFTATYDDQDRLLTYNSRTYSYNANGDLTQIQWNTTDTSSYDYDAIGALKSVTLSGGDVLTYAYDSQNRRVEKDQNGTFKYHYVYEDNYRIAAQVNSSGGVVKEYVYGTSPNVPDYMLNSSGVGFFFIKDHLGSPRLIVNVNNGTVSQQMDYNDLGEVVNDTNQGFQHFGFAGGIYDPQTQLVHFGARDYDPRSGRWTTKDPIRFGGGDTNLYGYVLQDPINLIDPSGLEGRCATDESCNSPIHNTPGGGGGGGGGKPFSPDQRAVVDLAKQAKKTGVERCEAETLADWAQQAGLKGQIHDPHEGTNTDYPHAHIGPVDHIRINE